MLSCVILELPCSCSFYDRGGREGGLIIESRIHPIT